MVENLLPEVRQRNLLAVRNLLKHPYGGVAPRVDNRPARSGNLPRHHDGRRKAVLTVLFPQIHLACELILAVVVKRFFFPIVRVKRYRFRHTVRPAGRTVKIMRKPAIAEAVHDFLRFRCMVVHKVNDDVRLHRFQLFDEIGVLFTVKQDTLHLMPSGCVLIWLRHFPCYRYRFISIVHKHRN